MVEAKSSRARLALAAYAFQLLTLMLTSATTMLLAGVVSVQDLAGDHWYAGSGHTHSPSYDACLGRYVGLNMPEICTSFLEELVTFALHCELLNFLICLPIYIYVDLLDLTTGLWLKWDLGAAVKSGSLVPDTALVRTVLTDKTGTLTTGDKVRQLY